MADQQQSLFGKTSPEFSTQKITHSDAFLPEYWGVMKPLKLKKGNGIRQAFYVLKPSEFVIESSMPNTLEWLNVAGEFFLLPCLKKLSETLEKMPVHPKYYLSEKACAGILHRASRKGKTLPEPLLTALKKKTENYK